MDRTTRRLLILGVVSTALLGLVGLLIAAEVALLVLPSPAPVRHQAWRLLALTALTTGLIAGVVGAGYFAVVDLLGGEQTLAQSVFAVFEGGVIFGAPGVVLGALAGSILALDYRRQVGRSTGAKEDVFSVESR